MRQRVSASKASVDFDHRDPPFCRLEALDVERTRSTRQRLRDVTGKFHEFSVFAGDSFGDLSRTNFEPGMGHGANAFPLQVDKRIDCILDPYSYLLNYQVGLARRHKFQFFHRMDNPKPLGGAPKQLVAAGKKIFDEGVPEAGIPQCSACHAPDAKGNGEFPRLAGQLHDYMFRKLVNWSKERGQDPANPDTSALMEPIAHSLTKDQIEAVAAYLSYLE